MRNVVEPRIGLLSVNENLLENNFNNKSQHYRKKTNRDVTNNNINHPKTEPMTYNHHWGIRSNGQYNRSTICVDPQLDEISEDSPGTSSAPLEITHEESLPMEQSKNTLSPIKIR